MKLSDHMTEEEFAQRVMDKAQAMRRALVPDAETRAQLSEEGVAAMLADVIATQAALCAVVMSNIKSLGASKLIGKESVRELATQAERLSAAVLTALKAEALGGDDVTIPDGVTCP